MLRAHCDRSVCVTVHTGVRARISTGARSGLDIEASFGAESGAARKETAAGKEGCRPRAAADHHRA